MANGELLLTPMAEEAAQCIYTAQSARDYLFTYLLRDEFEMGDRKSLRPVSVAAKFAVDGSGIYSDFIDTDPKLAEAFPESDIEDCARGGQYLLGNHMLLSLLDPKEVEGFVASQKPATADNNMRLKLLAGIQVMYDPEEEGLVPLMVYHKGLEGITFYKREKLAHSFMDNEDRRDRSVAELMAEADAEERSDLSLFYFPDAMTEASLGEVSARVLLRGEPIHY